MYYGYGFMVCPFNAVVSNIPVRLASQGKYVLGYDFKLALPVDYFSCAINTTVPTGTGPVPTADVVISIYGA